MKINPKARIDRGRVRVRRGGGRTGGFPMPGGGSGGGSGLPIPAGGGVVGIVLVVILFIVLAQCNGGIPGMGGSTSDSGSDEVADCETGADAAKSENCKLTLFVSAIERYWEEELPKQAGVEYSDAQLQIFSGSTSSGCGQASSAMGPFYCPADKYVYIDSTFFDDMLEKDLGAEGGDFAEAYVVAHEYGHHVQDLLGTMAEGAEPRDRSDEPVGTPGAAGRLLRGRLGAFRDDGRGRERRSLHHRHHRRRHPARDRRSHRGRRRPDPAADPGSRQRGAVDPRVGGGAGPLVHAGLPGRHPRLLRHLLGQLAVGLTAATCRRQTPGPSPASATAASSAARFGSPLTSTQDCGNPASRPRRRSSRTACTPSLSPPTTRACSPPATGASNRAA